MQQARRRSRLYGATWAATGGYHGLRGGRSPSFDGSFAANANGRPRGRPFGFVHRVEGKSVLGRPGSDLLFQALRLSTIGAGEFNGRVRDGIGFLAPR